MSEKIFFVSDTGFGYIDESGEKIFESDYIKKYKQNIIALQNKKEWKSTGTSAVFQERSFEQIDAEQDVFAKVTGICGGSGEVFYLTQCVGEMSGIFSKNLTGEAEQFLIHSNTQRFFSVEYNKETAEVLTAVENNSYTCDIALFDIKANNLKILTSGDSFDSDPSFSKGRDMILFSSRGLGRNPQMQFVGYGPSSIYIISRDTSTFKEILSDEKTDYLLPKEDKDGNLYYIKKPYIHKGTKQSIGFIDIVLAPIRLVHGLFKLVFFLSMQNSKENRNKYRKSKGDNPAKYKEQDSRGQLFLEEVDFDKEEAKNIKNKDGYAGFAPRRFELCRADKNGEKLLKRGVLDYVVLNDASIVYTNGRYIIKMLPSGEEKVLHKGKKFFKIGTKSECYNTSDIFEQGV